MVKSGYSPGSGPDVAWWPIAVAREHFQVAFAGALGPLHGRGFRIGHLGDQNVAGVLGCLAVVEAALRVQGIPVGGGGVQHAVAALAQMERAA